MTQLSFFDTTLDKATVNVSRVSQLSPFRYAGGKTWFVPTLRTWMKSFGSKPRMFIEPFCGGGICSLSVASEGLADHVVMVELDKCVASVWQTIFSVDAQWLIDKIVEFPEDPDLARSVIESEPRATHELAFQTIVRNRLLHGGILASGSRMIKNGENGRGPFSRWYPTTLAKRIKYLNEIRDRITFIHGDGFDVMRQYGRRKTACWFIDPPYTASAKSAGKRLYVHHELDHGRLFKTMSKVHGKVLMTYDNVPEVCDLASEHNYSVDTISMKNTHHTKKLELMITR